MKHETLRHSLLVLLNSVLCNPFKELLLQPTETKVSRLADAKVQLISQCTKLLEEKVVKLTIISKLNNPSLHKSNTTPYYII